LFSLIPCDSVPAAAKKDTDFTTYSGQPLILTVNIPHITTTKKVKFLTDMPASKLVATVIEQLVKQNLIDKSSANADLYALSLSTSDAFLADDKILVQQSQGKIKNLIDQCCFGI
jgi:hypothetical protein